MLRNSRRVVIAAVRQRQPLSNGFGCQQPQRTTASVIPSRCLHSSNSNNDRNDATFKADPRPGQQSSSLSEARASFLSQGSRRAVQPWATATRGRTTATTRLFSTTQVNSERNNTQMIVVSDDGTPFDDSVGYEISQPKYRPLSQLSTDILQPSRESGQTQIKMPQQQQLKPHENGHDESTVGVPSGRPLASSEIEEDLYDLDEDLDDIVEEAHSIAASALSPKGKSIPSLSSLLEEQALRHDREHNPEKKHYPALEWAKNFGRRSKEYEERLQPLIRLKPGDEGYFDVDGLAIPGVTIVRNQQDARTVLESLKNAPPSIFHACDTEVMDIDLKSVGPVGNGYVTCVSIYSGPDFDYGLGNGPGTTLWIDNLDDACGLLQEFKEWFEDENHLKVWHNYGFDRHVMWNEGIDVRGFGGDTMHMARLWDTSRGFVDANKPAGTAGGYSLEGLTADLVGRRKKPMKEIFGIKRLRKDGSEGSLVDLPPIEVMQRDPKYRSDWIQYSCFDAQGTWLLHEELKKILMQTGWIRDAENDNKIHYMYDYYFMHMRPFGEVLTDMERRGIRVDAREYLAKVELKAREEREHHSRAFREWAASKIGKADGLALNVGSSLQLGTFLFGGALNQKTKEPTETVRVFKVPREEVPEEALEYRMQAESEAKLDNTNDSKGADFFGDLEKLTAVQLKEACKASGLKMSGKKTELQERLREHLLNPQPELKEDVHGIGSMKVAELKAMCKEHGLQNTGKKAELQERLCEYFEKLNPSENQENSTNTSDTDDEIDSMSHDELRCILISRGISVPNGASRQDLVQLYRDDMEYATQLLEAQSPQSSDDYKRLGEKIDELARSGEGLLAQFINEAKQKASGPSKFVDITVTSLGLEPDKYTTGGAPSVTSDVIKKLAGDPFADPPKYGTAYERFGKEGCEALFSLGAIGSIDTMIANFLTPLQELADGDGRVHCSLNLNTETGRLSSRRPNLQNQPALEKDKYKIRYAFQASSGNNLIVADYGQLELRILASITECKSMIDAFASGGDFHSRTAIDMFPYVKEAVDSGEVLLEWDYSQGDPPKPLLKDKFASERRKAKTLNFSIAYGKTAHGLSQDWGVTTEEAENMLQAWYAARPEVKKWQAFRKETARQYGHTKTLMGRIRQLPGARYPGKARGHAERASINTPIQGGAADIAMMAMNKINNNEKLKELGWILMLQIHDEVILEGPEESAEEAYKEVINCMQEPWVFGLEKTAVPLLVDGSYKHKTWYDAK